MTQHNTRVLIVEPDDKLAQPYVWFKQALDQPVIVRVPTVEMALDEIQNNPPGLVCTSTSFAPLKIVKLLEALKLASTTHIVPMILVVNWQQRLTTIPGTTWGGKVGLLHSLSSVAEVRSTIERVMS